MQLLPIKTTKGDASAQVELRCTLTGKTIKWNEAAAKGWKVDLDGIPFDASSYYSPERQETLS